MDTEAIVHAVDDDRPFLRALERSLRGIGFAVTSHVRAQDFLDSVDPDLPGCLITDLRMPDMDGLALQAILRERRIDIPIIFMTGHGDTATAVVALKNGALDFLEKPFSEQQLIECIEPALEKNARDRELARGQSVVRARFDSLTPRERQIFELVVSDKSNKGIARELKISPRTVEHHREHVRLKMQANSQADLITMAVLCGIHELHLP